MLVIRLSRKGRKGLAIYRIVAADSRRAATAKVVAVLGTYNPHTKAVTLKQPELEKYLQNGAQPSSAVVKLLKAQKVKLPKWAEANLVVKKKAPKTKGKSEEGAAAEASADKPASTDGGGEKEEKDSKPEPKESAEEKPKTETPEAAENEPKQDAPAEEPKPKETSQKEQPETKA